MIIKVSSAVLSALQYTIVILMAPLTLAVCAGLLFCTYLITRQLARFSPPPAPKRTGLAHEWLGGTHTSEWLGA